MMLPAGFHEVERHGLSQTIDRWVGEDGTRWCPCHGAPMRVNSQGAYVCEPKRRKSNRMYSLLNREHNRGRNATPRQRAFVMHRDDNKCVYCGGRPTQIDHVVPWKYGGPTKEWNLAAACHPCNWKRHLLGAHWAEMLPPGWYLPIHSSDTYEGG